MYRIQERKYSSNIIEKKHIENGKQSWKPFIAPLGNKVNGDAECKRLLNYYNCL